MKTIETDLSGSAAAGGDLIVNDAELIRLCAELTATQQRIDSAFAVVTDEDECEATIQPLKAKCGQLADAVRALQPKTREGLRAMALALFTTEPQLANDPGAFGLNEAGNTLLSAILHTVAA